MLKLAKSLTCGECSDFFKSPKVLPCGHSVCQDCVTASPNAFKITCSICGKCSAFDHLTDLSPNTNLELAVEAFKEAFPDFIKAPTGGNDEGESCEHYEKIDERKMPCPHCDKPFCDNCKSIHTIRLNRDLFDSVDEVFTNIFAINLIS